MIKKIHGIFFFGLS